jgi:hypothetical protein
VAELRDRPVASTEPDEDLVFIPLGCARLRMSCLPLIEDGPEARPWQAVPEHVDVHALPRNRFDEDAIDFVDP